MGGWMDGWIDSELGRQTGIKTDTANTCYSLAILSLRTYVCIFFIYLLSMLHHPEVTLHAIM
jgi:hypothetical protein